MNFQKLNWWHKSLPPVFLSIITFLIYLPTFKYPFIYDDMPTITENIHVIRGGYLKGCFFAYNRWISRFLHSFIYKIWQDNPVPFRIFNLLIHISIGTLIFFTLLKVLTNLKKNNFLKQNAYIISIFTTALFLLHPTQTQTVTYITQMSLEGMVTLFTFGVIITFVYAVYATNIILKYFLYFLSIIFAIFAAGTKEIIIVLPPLILLIDIFFIAQGSWESLKKRIPFHLILWLGLFLTLTYLGFMPIKFAKSASKAITNNRGNVLTTTPKEKIEVGSYFLSQFKVLLHYIRIYLWPFPLAFEYGHKLSTSFWNYDVFLPFILILSIIFSALIGFIKNKSNALSFGVAWFFIGILPRASFIPSTELICDYKTYISSFGIIFLISVCIIYIFKLIPSTFKFKKLKIQLVSLGLILFLSALATKNQTKIWQDELAYWKHAIKVSPKKARLYNNYGVALSNRGRIEESIESYKKACECDPTYAEPVINLAFHYQAKNQKDLAMEQYKKAINMREVHPEMYLNLGSLHLNNKSYKQAEICFDIALKLRPYYSRAHFNKGLMYEQQGKLNLAFKSFENALQGNYKNIQFYYKYAKLAQKLNKHDFAIKNLELVKKLNPNFLDTVFTLASLYYEKRNYKNAAINFEHEYKKHPNNKVIAYNLAQCLLNIREYKKALPLFESCKNEIKLFPYAKLHIAKCLNELKQKDKAIYVLKNLINNPPHKGVLEDGISLLKSIIT
ncbi:tetratricopeptide repeat protein [Candidatus Dependentiae bacterium]|nr:tetratricopeptide repeat protein [Candidatus Dependentiae bacterium]